MTCYDTDSKYTKENYKARKGVSRRDRSGGLAEAAATRQTHQVIELIRKTVCFGICGNLRDRETQINHIRARKAFESMVCLLRRLKAGIPSQGAMLNSMKLAIIFHRKTKCSA